MGITALFVLCVGWVIPMGIAVIKCYFHPVSTIHGKPILENEDGVYFFGHASVLIIVDGVRILVDPVWSKTIGGVIRRFIMPPLPIEKIGPVDAICLSHWHFDHFDRKTVSKFPHSTPIIAPKNVRNSLAKRGFDTFYIAAVNQEIKIGSVTVIPVPSNHYSSPEGVGFVILGTKTVYHAGDTAKNPEFMTELGQRFDLDLALLPIGAYRGLAPMGLVMDFNKVHMNPQDAADSFELAKPKRAAAMHHGVFRIMTEPVDEPGRWMRKIIDKKDWGKRFLMPEVGDFISFTNK